MKARVPKLAAVALAFLLAGLFWQLQVRNDSPSEEKPPMATLGSVETLLAAYDRWRARTTGYGGDRNLVLSLGYTKGLSATLTRARGGMTLDLVDGSVDVEVAGFAEEDTFDVWLIDNRPGPGRSVKPEPGDVMMHLGSLQHEGGTAKLQATLDRDTLTDFQLDLVVVARTGEDPGEAGLLFGAPNLFQRLYHSELRGQFPALGDEAAPVGDDATRPSLLAAPFRALVPSPAHAQVASVVVPLPAATTALQQLIATGQDLFLNETFDGNGRTCGTCHRPTNNFAIDPVFIASLECDDPLFVAEHAAAPGACPTAPLQDPSLATLERPELMRQFGLILENVDGTQDLENIFTMRGVPHTLALSTSVAGSAGAFVELTGWSGDGSPSDPSILREDGSLRAFAIGAVRQHLTQTLDRIEGVDFRLPTGPELNAMEAFQLALGRNADPNLGPNPDDPTQGPGLELRGVVPSLGQDLFLNGTGDPNAGGRCNVCHFNAGANAGFISPPGTVGSLINTQVESLEDAQVRLDGIEDFPCDGGFGRNPGTFSVLCNPDSVPTNQVFGDGTFNTPGVVESADTGPFFHNNTITTIEGAVAFYNSNAFNDPRPPQLQFDLEPSQVEAIAAFLRAINALENVRNSIALDRRAAHILTSFPGENVNPLLRVSRADVRDGIEVLSAVNLHLDAVALLQEARALLQDAIQETDPSTKVHLITNAIRKQRRARRRICVRGSDRTLCPYSTA